MDFLYLEYNYYHLWQAYPDGTTIFGRSWPPTASTARLRPSGGSKVQSELAQACWLDMQLRCAALGGIAALEPAAGSLRAEQWLLWEPVCE